MAKSKRAVYETRKETVKQIFPIDDEPVIRTMDKPLIIRILAVAGDERSAVLPNVPSFKEAGLDISIRTWFGMFAPAATPRDIVQRLNAEVAKLLRVPQFKDKFLTAQGIEINGPAGGSTEDFARYIRQEREMYANMVKVVGLKVD